MKKAGFIILLFVTVLSITSCFEDESCKDPISTTALTIDTSLNDTITSGGYKNYTFQAVSSGSYTIDLTGLTSDCDLYLWFYISDCAGDYSNNGYIDNSSYLGTTNESITANLAPGKYLIIVYEYDDMGDSSYTIEVQN